MTSLKFGTSGLRGLVTELVGLPAYSHVRAFGDVIAEDKAAGPAGEVLIGRDLRSSSPLIAAQCASAIADAGLKPVDCGAVPTPALALAAMRLGAPAVMVTGSHIPEDRNGLKFYLADSEIDKQGEQDILRFHAELDAAVAPSSPPDVEQSGRQPLDDYLARYSNVFPPRCLEGLRVGVYQHSSVARDILVAMVEAQRSFWDIPVDRLRR